MVSVLLTVLLLLRSSFAWLFLFLGGGAVRGCGKVHMFKLSRLSE